MGYEGYDRYMCAAGHLAEVDCMEHGADSATCHCGKPLWLVECVDRTNCAGCPYPLIESTPARVDVCKACGHSAVVTPAAYIVPTRAQIAEYRKSLDCESCEQEG